MAVVGDLLGHYRLLEEIGAGGMGVVFRARDERIDRDVALKLIPAHLLQDETARKRFRQEARTLSRLSHPNIASLFEFDSEGDIEFIVMELVQGLSLRQRIGGAPMSLKDVCSLTAQMTAGLTAAHAAGIVHRDLKPENIVVNAEGHLKILDFGLAILAPDAMRDAATVTSVAGSSGAEGTLLYMAPEQLRGEAVDGRADIYAAGAVLYEMATGRPPFSERGPMLVDAILNRDPKPAAKVNPNLAPGLANIIEKAMDKDPDQRYQSARELGIDINRLTTARSGQVVEIVRPRRKVPVIALSIAGVAVLALVAAGAWVATRAPSVVRPEEYVPLTNFADSATNPALSPDGRMLAFIRGDNTFIGEGEVYVKMLPDGEPRQVTHDGTKKAFPAFAPSGDSIAYFGNSATRVVSILGGPSRDLLANADGLHWIAPGRVMFSEYRGQGLHMGVVTSDESRYGVKDVYVPEDVNGMAHRSALSPDGRSVLIVEMDLAGWLPCRVVPFDGQSNTPSAAKPAAAGDPVSNTPSAAKPAAAGDPVSNTPSAAKPAAAGDPGSRGRQIGPPDSQCTSVAWSPDGKWMYLSANSGNGFHIWRQRFPDGKPEQVTFGATEEQGIAFAPDGKSFVTSIGSSQSTIWIHDPRGERQLSSEGFAFLPSFSRDGKSLYYLVRSGTSRHFVSGELHEADLKTGDDRQLLKGFTMEHYDVSDDGRSVLFISTDAAGKSPVWLAPLDGSASPRKLSEIDSSRVLFGQNHDAYFVGGERGSPHLYHIMLDGSGLKQLLPEPVTYLYSISPDGKWLGIWISQDMSVRALAADGSRQIEVCNQCATAGGEDRGITPPMLSWSRDQKSVYLHFPIKARETIVVPLQPGEIVPVFPGNAVRSVAEVQAVRHGMVLGQPRPFVGGDPSTFAFLRGTTHRNIYRVPVP